MTYSISRNNQFSIISLMLILAASALILSGCSNQSETSDQEDQNSTELIDENIQHVEQEMFSNNYARVLKVELDSGQQLPWHEGGPRVIYSLTDYTIQLKKNPEDTTTQTTSWSEGDAHWHNQNVHTVENIGESKAEFLVFMRKPASFPEENGVTTQSDIQDEVPSDTNVLLENDAVKVIDVSLDAGENVPMHTGTKRLIYSMNDYSIQFDKPDIPGEVNRFTEGDVHWHEGGKHSVNNISDKPAEFLVVEFKK